MDCEDLWRSCPVLDLRVGPAGKPHAAAEAVGGAVGSLGGRAREAAGGAELTSVGFMAAAGGGTGLRASPGLETAMLQKLALRRKKVLGAEDAELYELAQAAGAAVDPDVFKILVDLLNLNVAPLAVFQMLKSMCAGQRLAGEPQDSGSVSLPTSETRGRNRGGPTLGSAPTLAERGSREGSTQRMPRQPSATRPPKVGGSGKSTSRGSS